VFIPSSNPILLDWMYLPVTGSIPAILRLANKFANIKIATLQLQKQSSLLSFNAFSIIVFICSLSKYCPGNLKFSLKMFLSLFGYLFGLSSLSGLIF